MASHTQLLVYFHPPSPRYYYWESRSAERHDLSALALKHKATIPTFRHHSIFSDHSENNAKRGEETAPSHNAHEKIFTGTKPAKFSKTANEKNGKNKGKGKGKGEGEGKKQRTKEKKRERETKRKGLEEKGETKVSPEESTPESPFVCEVDQISESSLARLALFGRNPFTTLFYMQHIISFLKILKLVMSPVHQFHL